MGWYCTAGAIETYRGYLKLVPEVTFYASPEDK
jgi:hypothetical protein